MCPPETRARTRTRTVTVTVNRTRTPSPNPSPNPNLNPNPIPTPNQVIYHGLLSIGVMIANPLGTDLIDFPGSFYQHVMKAELSGFATCVDAHSANLKAAKPKGS